MKTFVCFIALFFGTILAGPIPEDSKGFFVTTVNKTAVCVVKGSVYQDGERLPMDDPCEICRCRPPGFACAYVRCAKRDPKPGCNVVDLVGQCCPQYRCVEEELPPVPPVAEVTSSKPILLEDEPLEPLANQSAIIANEIVAKNDAIATSEAPALLLAEEPARSEQPPPVSESLPLEQRDGLQPEPSSERPPAVEDLGKSLDIISTEQPAAAGELPREERVEFNEIHANANENAVTEGRRDQDEGRSGLLASSQPPQEIIAERSGVDDDVTSFFLLAEATSSPQVRIADSEQDLALSASSQPPEKIERKDDDLDDDDEDRKLIEASSLPPPPPIILKEQAVIIDDKAPVIVVTDQPSLSAANDSQSQSGQGEREKRETVETIEEKELLQVIVTTILPPVAGDQLKEKADEAELPKDIDTKAEVHRDNNNNNNNNNEDDNDDDELAEAKTEALLNESLPETKEILAEEHKLSDNLAEATTAQSLN